MPHLPRYSHEVREHPGVASVSRQRIRGVDWWIVETAPGWGFEYAAGKFHHRTAHDTVADMCEAVSTWLVREPEKFSDVLERNGCKRR